MSPSSLPKRSGKYAKRNLQRTTIALALGVAVAGMAHAVDSTWIGGSAATPENPGLPADITYGPNWSGGVSPLINKAGNSEPLDIVAMINAVSPLAELFRPRLPAQGEPGAGSGLDMRGDWRSGQEFLIGSGAQKKETLKITPMPSLSAAMGADIAALHAGKNGVTDPAAPGDRLPAPFLRVGDRGAQAH